MEVEKPSLDQSLKGQSPEDQAELEQGPKSQDLKSLKSLQNPKENQEH